MAQPNDQPHYAENRPDAVAARCPCCDGALVRVRRHLGDRLLSLLTPMRRYRCDALGCRWEGTLRYRRGAAGPVALAARRPR